MRTVVVIAGDPVAVEIRRAGDAIEAEVGGRSYRATVDRSGESWRIVLPERTLALTVVREGDEAWIAVDGEIYRCTTRAEDQAAVGSAAARTPHVTAPMPGRVLDVLVREGQQVAAGDSLVILEAMKMETVATADAAGTVVHVHVRAGAMVEPGQMLVELAFA